MNTIETTSRRFRRRFGLAPRLAGLASILFGLAGGAFAIDSPQARFQAANEAYKAQKYEEALQGYEGLIADGARDSTVYYNAGCALAQLGRRGRAAAMFERALKLEPRFEDARDNLRRVRPEAPEREPFFLLAPFAALSRAFSAETFFLLAAAGYWLLALGAGCRILLESAAWRRIAGAAAGLGLAVLLVFGPFFLHASARETRAEAIVIADKTQTRSGPSEAFLEQDLLSEGIKVRILEPAREGWVKIQLPGGAPGYVPESAIEAI
ncbi:MAG: Tetratricopeptide repeat protein [candidate division BRC1 bacterium ADurb.BinA364]|nr:MAG: Tetratricopeptide repeat protein [candidate division BRC1 bacterium ADurb.BinA364]